LCSFWTYILFFTSRWIITYKNYFTYIIVYYYFLRRFTVYFTLFYSYFDFCAIILWLVYCNYRGLLPILCSWKIKFKVNNLKRPQKSYKMFANLLARCLKHLLNISPYLILLYILRLLHTLYLTILLPQLICFRTYVINCL
jgi:hypothetical protein